MGWEAEQTATGFDLMLDRRPVAYDLENLDEVAAVIRRQDAAVRQIIVVERDGYRVPVSLVR